jgi:fumarylacetoacetate (FAA) hydrolase
MAPLPRAYQCVEGVGFVSHLELLYKSRGVEVPATLSSEPQWSQCSGDALHGPCEPIVCESEDVGIDFSAGLAAITSDLPMGCPGDRALDGVRLLMLCNRTRLHHLGGACAGTAFSPVAATPDELGDLWTRGRVHAPLQVAWNGRKVGLCDAGADMHFHFGRLLSQVCQTRRVCAGSIVTSGPVSNKGMERKGRPDWPNGYSSIAEKRAMETLQDGQASTEFMRFGDALRIDMKGRDGSSIFGAIDQEVATPASYAN